MSLADLFAGGPPTSATRRPLVSVAANLSDDPGSWLLRLLWALNADRVAVLVPNTHPDLVNATAQSALTDLVRDKYALRLRRSTPTNRLAIVEATAVRPADRPSTLAHWLLSRAHGKLGNVLREGLIRAAETGTPMTKHEARARAAALVPRPEWLDARLIDLPRHAVTQLLAASDGDPA
jgi:hypothetical protein